MTVPTGVEIRGDIEGAGSEILSQEALDYLADLHRTFDGRRQQLLEARAERQRQISAGASLGFLPETKEVREGDWKVAPPPPDLLDRRVEITGPVDRRMMINALNSGATVFMADFEDANSPTWANNLEGHRNLIDAIEGRIEFTNPDGREYRLGPNPAYLLVRPRGWHLPEKHLVIDGRPISGALFDFGLYTFHCARRRRARGLGTYFYLPKLQSHLEARLWDDVMDEAEQRLGLDVGTLRATVLIETIWAAFEMDEILFELRRHSIGLNAGRWDYMFSTIKTFGERADMVLPDRAQVTMTVPFMRAYTELLVRTCHRRGTFAMGGMAAFIPSRRDAEVNRIALEKVREDKEREAGDGFDGTWVAHPDLVEVAKKAFDEVLGDRPNQIERTREDVHVEGSQLVDVRIPGGAITEAGLRTNVSVGIRYIESWLRGNGAAAIDNLMEDAATAEISRSQVWQWAHHGSRLDDGRVVTAEMVRQTEDEELDRIREAMGDGYPAARFETARRLFDQVALAEPLAEFLTPSAYELLE
ncbi:MAG TPA: malate synthase A [Candidatus Dormibacteraeota bacterium]|jgi:malate synthase|nr:malate synthase A [Candidatus Dormibacteraeota bacterium]